MGWLFGKKKSKVPFPESRSLDEGALRFPTRSSMDRIIEPEQLKAAVGIEQPMMRSAPEPALSLSMPRSYSLPTEAMPASSKISAGAEVDEPLFVHIDVYRQVLGAIDDLKKGVNSLQETSKHLESSEYNEEANFTKLRRAVKSMHDRILQMDKVVFKSQ